MKHTILSFTVLLLSWLSTLSAQVPDVSDPIPAKKDLPLPGEVFLVSGRAAFLIPAKSEPSAKAKPWVWYAPTLPGLPGEEEHWMFDQFRDAGIAIAGIDVGESYGSPAGRRLFTTFHAEMTGPRGYSLKPVLLGRSRGGLMTLSWAAENPDQVAGFAGIYPVCNLESYPGVTKAADAYGLAGEELQAHLAAYNPIDRLAPLARCGIPLFAIHGDADRLVPLEANSGLMKERYIGLGGRMELIVPKGQGHNMWSGFFQSKELVNFVKSNANRRDRSGNAKEGGGLSTMPLAEEGFVSIFNGQDLAGWDGPDATVQEGAMVCFGKHSGALLYTKADYTNFILRFEFKLTPGANNGLNFRTDGPTWNEIQILDDTHPMFATIHPYQAHGSIYGVVPARRGFLKPVGQWNSQEVLADGSRITVTLNGTIIVDADLSKFDLDKCVDGHAHPGLRRTAGKIAWLGHLNAYEKEGPVYFRNIRIKTLR